MSGGTGAASPLVDVRRGEGVDVIELIDADGNVVLCHAHGVHNDERLRTREALLRLLRGVLATAKAPGSEAAVGT